jgi:hypothetical protein
MSMKLRIACLLLLPVALPSAARAQANPYTLDQVVELVGSGLPAARVLEMVRGKCIAFAMEPGTEMQLRNAGGSAELMQGLRGICTTVKPQPAPTIPTVRSAPSAGSAALKSIVIPGLGQLTTGRPVMGALFLGAAGGALAAGAMSKSVTVLCASPTTGTCPSNDVIREDSESKLPLGLAAYGAVALVSAIEAMLGAKGAQAALGASPVEPSVTTDGRGRTRLALQIRF